MKKLLLAGVISLAAAGIAHADSTAVLKVRGTLTNASCTPTLSDGGVVNFGKISMDNLSPTVANQLGYKDISLAINCQSPTKVGWSVTDDRADSNPLNELNKTQFKIIGSAFGGGDFWTRSMTYGLGKTGNNENIGAFSISVLLDSVTADGASASAVTGYPSHPTMGDMWSENPYGAPHNDGTNVMTITHGDNGEPAAFTNAVFPIRVGMAIVNTDRLTMTDDTELDGQATLTLVYL